MATALLQSIFCCCSHSRAAEEPQIPHHPDLYDETTHLIPEEIEPPVIYGSNGNLIDYQQWQERLTDIVRSKQSKMVNVASRIPFNLHNQVIPHAESSSRSASRSIDDRYDSRYYYNAYSEYHSSNDNRQRGNFYGRGSRSRSPSPSPHAGSFNGGQPQEDITEQPKPTPILNLRLVGYNENQFRGRARARGPVPPVFPSLSQPKPQTEDSATPVANAFPNIEVTTPTQQQSIPVFKIHDQTPMTLSW